MTATTTYADKKLDFRTHLAQSPSGGQAEQAAGQSASGTRELDATGSVVFHPDHQELHLPSLALRTQGVEWKGADNATLQEDRVLLESAQGNYERGGADFERHAPADYPPLLARRLLALARDGEWPARREDIVPRKLVLVRQ